MIHLKKLIMTLVALIAVTTGAWAESKPIGLNVEYAVGDVITSTTDVYVYYGEQPSTSKQMAVKITSTEPRTIVEIYANSFAIEGDAAVYYLPDGDATNGYAGGIPCFGESTGDATVVHVASGSGTLADPYVFAPGTAASGTPVALTWDATAQTATLTNGMPAGNVTVSVDYYPQATAEGAVTEATDVKATTDAPLVTIDKTKLTGVAKMMYYVSTDANATAPDYDAEGWTDKVPTAENYTEAGNLKVWYYPVGTDEGVDEATATYSDGDMNATALAVSLGDAPTYDVTLNAEGLSDEEAAAWKVAKGDATPAAFPLEGVKKGETVTVTYSGTRKVIGVKAEKKSSAPTLKDALADGATVVINYTWFGTDVTTFTYTNNAGTFTGNATGIEAEYFDNGMSMDGTTLKFTASNKDMSDANVSIDFNTDTNGYVANKGSAFTSFTISVNGTEISVSEVVVEVVDETGD